MKSPRLFLSPPHLGNEEFDLVRQVFESNYIAPLGPMVDAFEREFAEYTGIPHCVALSSGTAAMHLALRELGVGPSDDVLASTLTFVGSVTPATFLGASVVFIDSDDQSWNMDPGLLEAELAECARRGKLPKAVIPTDLYGQCADLNTINNICETYGIPVVADAAEAMGARYYQRTEVRGQESEGKHEASTPHPALSPVEAQRVAGGLDASTPSSATNSLSSSDEDLSRLGSGERSAPEAQALEGPSERAQASHWAGVRSRLFTSILDPQSSNFVHAGYSARAAVFSFNGNKIITTSGGGMLASHDERLIAHARKLSQQAREPAPHYEHTEIGYNYRLSNILAAIGRGQLRVLDERVERKRHIFAAYRELLGDLPGIEFMPEASHSRSNRWLTVILITPTQFGATNEEVRLALEAENIESRPLWKPMHLQPVFHGCRIRAGAVSERLFNLGLCLPSGTAMTDADLERVAGVIRKCGKAKTAESCKRGFSGIRADTIWALIQPDPTESDR